MKKNDSRTLWERTPSRWDFTGAKKQGKIWEILTECSSQAATQKKNVEQTARRTEQYRAQSRQKKAEMEKKRLKLEDVRRRINNLKETLEEIDDQKSTMEDKSKQLQEMIQVKYTEFFVNWPVNQRFVR